MEPSLPDLYDLLLVEDQDTGIDTSSNDRRHERDRKRQARHRDKRRDELIQLRLEHESLTAQLALLLQTTDSDQQMPRGGWRGAAMRQLRRRARSHALNRDLRSQVIHMQLAVQKMERTCLDLVMNKPSLLMRRLKDPVRPVEVFPWEVQRMISLAKELEVMYAQASAMLTGCERPTTAMQPCTWEVNRRWDAIQDREYVEVLQSRAVPFPLEEAVAAGQRALLSMLKKEYPIATSQELAGATAVKVVVIETKNGKPAEHLSLWVGRVFVELERAVFCWRSVGLDDAPDTAEFLEHGWGIAQPLADESTGSNGTKFVFCTHYSMTTEVAAKHGHLFEIFADCMTEEPEKEAAEWLEAMEDAVLDGVASLSVN